MGKFTKKPQKGPSKEDTARPPDSAVFRVFQSDKGLIARVLRRYRLSQIDVADITQETLLRALEAEKRFEIKEPRGYLVGIAKNVARDEIERRAKISMQLLDDLAPQTYIADEPAVDEIVDARRRMRLLFETAATLPPQCQKVFILKHVHGVSHKEIADKMDIAVSTVEKHVALGLKRCREAMLKEMKESRYDDPSSSILGYKTKVKRV